MTPDDLDRLLAAATPAPWESHSTICCPDRGWVTGQETGHTQPTHAFSVADAEMVATLRNIAPALIRLWRAASREANTPTIRRLRDYEIDAALHELEAHRP